MAGQIPSFITGANAKIKVGNLTMAYAQDVSYSIDVSTIPVETIGRYEVVTNEPVAYYVSGTLAVIRYTKAVAAAGASSGATANTGTGSSSSVPNTAANGNSVNNWNDATGGGNIGYHLNPGQLLNSKTFDLEILSKLPEDAGTSGTSATPQESIIKIRDCRLTRKGGSVTKRGLVVDQFAFTAVLADNDAVTASSTSSSDTDLG